MIHETGHIHCINYEMVFRGDEELDTLIKATIAGGGVIPHIHKSLIGKKVQLTDFVVILIWLFFRVRVVCLLMSKRIPLLKNATNPLIFVKLFCFNPM